MAKKDKSKKASKAAKATKVAPKPAAKPAAKKVTFKTPPVKAKAAPAPTKTLAQDLYDALTTFTGGKPTTADVKKFEQTGVPFSKGKYLTDKPVVPTKGGKPVINKDTVTKFASEKPKKGSYSAQQLADAEFKRYKAEGKLDLDAFEYLGSLFSSQDETDRWKYNKVKNGEMKVAAAERDRLKNAVVTTGNVKETTLKGGEKHFTFPTLTEEGAQLVKEGALEAIKAIKAGKPEKEAMKPLEDLLKKGPTKELTRDALLEAVKKVEKDANVTGPIKERLEKGFRKEETRPELEKTRKTAVEAPKKPLAEYAKAGPKADITSPLLKQVLAQQGKAPNIAKPLENLAGRTPAQTIAGPVAQKLAAQATASPNIFRKAKQVARREYERLQPQLGAQYLGQGTRASSAYNAASQEAKLNLSERLGRLKGELKLAQQNQAIGALPSLIGAAETQLGGETQRAQALSGARATEAGLGQQQLNTLLGRLGINEQQQLQLAQALGSEELAGKTLNLDQFKTLLNQMNISEAQQSQLLGMLTNAGLNTAQLDVTKLGQFLGAQQAEQNRQLQTAGAYGKQQILQAGQNLGGLQTLANLGTKPTEEVAFQGAQPTFFQNVAAGAGAAIPAIATLGLKYASGGVL
jgi:hypothetical protein